MTREGAKGNLIHAIRWNDMPKKEALDMAIQALEQEPCEDAISRQMLKAKMFDLPKPPSNKTYWDGVDDVGDLIDKLPLVTAQYTDAEIQKMQDLKFAEIQKAYEIGKAERSIDADVLNEIREEIVHLHDWAFSREEILRIIDKYKADKEEVKIDTVCM